MKNFFKNQNDKKEEPESAPVKKEETAEEKPAEKEPEEKVKPKSEFPKDIKVCEQLVKDLFHSSSDIIIHPFMTVMGMAMVVYVDGMSDKNLMDRDIVGPLKAPDFTGDIHETIRATQVAEVTEVKKFIKDVLDGNTAIFIEGSAIAFTVDFKSFPMRGVETPDSEAVLRGPKEGFTEAIRPNTALLRRKLKTPNLVIENLSLGKQTNTLVGIAYIEGIVNKEVLEEVKKRISKIDTDAVLESGYIEQYIEDKTISPIPTIGSTQKPDIVAAKILEGRVAIFCDGTPHVLTIPQLFIENIQISEDYYNRFTYSVALRILRIIALFLTMLLPGFFVAITTYNQEMIPTVFMVTLMAASSKVPLPAGAETFFLMLMFELLKESGTRLPRPIGSAISIVGALIIGEAAVNAGIVGAPAVIVIALTAVTSFVNPNLNEFTLVYKFFFLFLGGTFGILGIGTGLMIMVTQIASTTSYGIPILSSFSKEELKDTIIRFPLQTMKLRPASITKTNQRRQSQNMKL